METGFLTLLRLVRGDESVWTQPQPTDPIFWEARIPEQELKFVINCRFDLEGYDGWTVTEFRIVMPQEKWANLTAVLLTDENIPPALIQEGQYKYEVRHEVITPMGGRMFLEGKEKMPELDP
jgi:hypothetical protein